MLGFLGSSLVSLVMAMSDGQGVQSALQWLLGDLTRARFSSAVMAVGVALMAAVYLLLRGRALDTFLLGQEGAASLGTDVARERAWMLLLSSLLVAVCVSAAGMIGFLGLMVPHAVRAWVGSRHRYVIPVAAVWGSAALVWSDLLAKNVVRPNEIPVGVVTSLVGAPVFLMMVLRRRRDAA
jgi:iron complex transport system permease protein